MHTQRKVYFIAQEHDTGDECTHHHHYEDDAAKCAYKHQRATNTQWHVVKVTQSN